MSLRQSIRIHYFRFIVYFCLVPDGIVHFLVFSKVIFYKVFVRECEHRIILRCWFSLRNDASKLPIERVFWIMRDF